LLVLSSSTRCFSFLMVDHGRLHNSPSRVYLKAPSDRTRKLFPRVVNDIAKGIYRRDEKGQLD
jgi:hypothetical protein